MQEDAPLEVLETHKSFPNISPLRIPKYSHLNGSTCSQLHVLLSAGSISPVAPVGWQVTARAAQGENKTRPYRNAAVARGFTDSQGGSVLLRDLHAKIATRRITTTLLKAFHAALEDWSPPMATPAESS